MKFHLPQSTHNWTTIIGSMIAIISFFMICFLFTVSIFWVETNVYLGLVIYILLPSIMVMGLILIPIGMIIQKRKNYKNLEVERKLWPTIDLNLVKHRNALFIFSISTTLLLFVSAIGSYGTFQFTESVTFCGQICHEVMLPEFTAYQHSSHAKVKCVECHVGSGADWYVRSKISGLYQVYSVFNNKYPRPIPTPIENLRPAKEVCEHCQYFYRF